MKAKNAALMSLIVVGFAASASAITISGTDLSGLTYRDNGGTAQYVPASGLTPPLAALSTPDSGVNGGAPTVYVKAANVGLPSLGALNNFSASYDLFGTPTGPSAPYWLTYLYAPGGGYIGVISSGGPDLNGSTAIHVIYDFDLDPNSHTTSTYWGDTLSQLDSILYNGTSTFGQMAVYETGVEIGDWDNGTSVIPASANIESITVSVPDGGSTVLLLGSALTGLAMLRRRFQA